MGFVTSVLGSTVGRFMSETPYWAVKLASGAWQCEHDTVWSVAQAQKRPFDWTLDLVSTGDILHVKELWLFCPPTPLSPLGSTAKLPIVEPGTAFQFKVSTVDALGAWGRTLQSHIIGRVTDKATGDCDFFVWDAPLRALSTPMRNNIYHFTSWRPDLAPIGALAPGVLGLKLD